MIGVSIRDFAALAGCDTKVVQRKLASGHLPRLPSGKLDPRHAAMDWRNGVKTLADDVSTDVDIVDTKTPEEAAQTAQWRARGGAGYEYGQHVLLAGLVQHGAELMVEAMRLVGATSEDEVARAAAAFRETVDIVACVLFNEANRSGVTNYNDVLPATVAPTFRSPEAAAIYLSLTDLEHAPDYDETASDWWDCEFFQMVADAFRSASIRTEVG